MKTVQYVIITPVRNEQQYVQKAIESIVAQTTRPKKWVIVDDGSTDGTGGIVDEAERQHDWIKVLHRADRGFRRAGGGVMEAFFDGLALVGEETW